MDSDWSRVSSKLTVIRGRANVLVVLSNTTATTATVLAAKGLP